MVRKGTALREHYTENQPNGVSERSDRLNQGVCAKTNGVGGTQGFPNTSKIWMTRRIGAKVVLALLKGDQEFFQQDPDPWCLSRVCSGIHAEVCDARGELLNGSKAVLEEFKRDGGRCERRHWSDATELRIPLNHPSAPCRKCIGINPPEEGGKTQSQQAH